MSEYLDAWLTRCKFNEKCVLYHKMDYDCAIDQSRCVLYGLWERNLLSEKDKGVLETILESESK